MFEMLRTPFILLLLTSFSISKQSLEIVSDNELIDLVRSEKYVVVLFTKKDCEACDSLESELINVREDLVDELNCWVVKTINSNMVKLYNPSKEPALVFFRHGIPLLYDGPLSEEKILHTFSNNRVPSVKELSDENFEHLTQASSGATTGDWFVMFYTDNCVDCERLHARWEAVGARLKTRLNVARVNKGSTGAVTGRRFGVGEVPAFILFRQGKMYRYQLPLYDVNSFASFATDWFKNAKAETIPVPKSPFDDFTQMIADYLQENTWLLGVGLLSFLIGIIAAVNALRTPTKKPAKKKDKEQKDKEQSKEKSKKSK